VLVLLFSQWMTLAYACPDQTGRQHAAAMPDCPDNRGGAAGPAQMDPEHPLLCKSSCDPAGQSSVQGGKLLALDLTASPPLLVLDLVSLLDQTSSFTASREHRAGHSPPGWPPLYLLHLSLRN